MLNMDMIGRMRSNKLTVLGGGTAKEWDSILTPLCNKARVSCSLGGSGYGPSDQMSFYAEGIPVLHFFTGAHGDYHKTTDDVDDLNVSGAVRVAEIVGDTAEALANRDSRLTYRRVAPPPPKGDARSFGASMGTIPRLRARRRWSSGRPVIWGAP